MSKAKTRTRQESCISLARQYLKSEYTTRKGITLRYWRDQFYQWWGDSYRCISDSELRVRVLNWLSECKKNRATPRTAHQIIKCLESICVVCFDTEPPSYLGGKCFSDSKIPMHYSVCDLSGLLHQGIVKTHQRTPKLFNLGTLPYCYDTDATCDLWLAYLDCVLDGDIERIELLQEWFGYCLTRKTMLHAIMILDGPPGSGREIICRVLRSLVGERNCVEPRLEMLSEPYGMERLKGKTNAIYPSAHLGNADEAFTIMEILKSISGNDFVEVHRKGKSSISCCMKIRCTLGVSEMPEFGDGGNSHLQNLIILPLRQSGLGRQESILKQILEDEIPGIFKWALEGLYRLLNQREFTKPKYEPDNYVKCKKLPFPN